MLGDHYWTDPAGTRHLVGSEPKTADSTLFALCMVPIVIPTNGWESGWCMECVLRASAALEVPRVRT